MYTAHSVQSAAGNRYLAYTVLQREVSDAPIIVARSTYTDALTFARTLKQGIENMLKHYIPEIVAVEPVA